MIVAPIRVIQKYQIMKHVGFADVFKKVKDVKSDDKSEEGENVILQVRLSKREGLLEWLHWSLKLNMCRPKSSFVRKR